MPRFYKGVGVGTFLHSSDLRVSGVVPAKPGASFNLQTVAQHITGGVVTSPCISMTRSYAVADDYARNASHAPPTASNPSFVYVIDVPDQLPLAVALCDPVEYVSSQSNNSLANFTYHHNGGSRFLLAVVDPIAHAAMLKMPPVRPPGMSGGVLAGPRLTPELESMVNALRDAEVLVVGNLPSAWINHRYDIF